jgi:hypothetical protein
LESNEKSAAEYPYSEAALLAAVGLLLKHADASIYGLCDDEGQIYEEGDCVYSDGPNASDELQAIVQELRRLRDAANNMPTVSGGRKDKARLDWLESQNEVAVGSQGCGEYDQYAGVFWGKTVRELCDEHIQNDQTDAQEKSQEEM